MQGHTHKHTRAHPHSFTRDEIQYKEFRTIQCYELGTQLNRSVGDCSQWFATCFATQNDIKTEMQLFTTKCVANQYLPK